MANALGELVGLGLVAAIGGGLVWRFGEPHTTGLVLSFAILMILLGAGEGFLIGLAQWLAISPYFRSLPRRDWVKATIFGAVIAWGLGMIPSTLFALQEGATTAPSPPLDEPAKYFMAAVMGAGLGVVLGLPQWMVLRHYVNHATWWVGANAAAWMVGMPLIFFGAGTLPGQVEGWLLILLVTFTLTTTGAAVGAIHGGMLVWLLQRRR